MEPLFNSRARHKSPESACYSNKSDQGLFNLHLLSVIWQKKDVGEVQIFRFGGWVLGYLSSRKGVKGSLLWPSSCRCWLVKSQATLSPVEIPELLDCLNLSGPGQQPTSSKASALPRIWGTPLGFGSAERGEPPPQHQARRWPTSWCAGESHFLPTRPQVSRLHQDPSGGGG